MINVASVAVENTGFCYDKLFDYIIPENILNQIKIGSRVTVPFGIGNKTRFAVVILLKEQEETKIKYKSIGTLIDNEPLINEQMLDLARFMSNRYFCSIYECIKTMIPIGLNYKLYKSYIVIDRNLPSNTTELQRNIFSVIEKSNKPVNFIKLKEIFNTEIEKDIDFLLDNKIIKETESPIRNINDATIKSVRLIDYNAETELTKKQKEAYEVLKITDGASVKEICYFTGLTVSVIDALVKKGVAEYYEKDYYRTPKSEYSQKNKKYILTDEQTKALSEIKTRYNSDKAEVSLLYGITGSGKTSVFMNLIDSVLEDNKDIIILVPEISLTPQMMSIFKGRYGDNIAIFHSGLSMGERLDQWKMVKNGIVKIAIGTRSAVFAPFNNLGLIIIDEEQEATYKSEQSPKYNTIEVAKFRILQSNGLLLLASATPSIESRYYAETGKYSLSVLKNRYGKAILPEVITADMNKELEFGNRTGFSSVLLEKIEKNLENHNQTIILLNRRGHNTYVSCKSCGKIITCPNCSISLTYHSANNRLMCHYCGYSLQYNEVCPECGTKSLRMSGTGTQKAEKQLEDIFPNAKILRLDADATMTKYSHEKKLKAFSDGEYDILIGTQMVAKGLDFPNVTLVGVLSADQILYGDDFRSYERAFSLITQVVGRSGRGDKKGTAIIQTFTPESEIISLASAQNYDDFYKTEIKIRKAMLYPPFVDLCLIGFMSKDREKARVSAEIFNKTLCGVLKEEYSDLPIRVLGPSVSAVPKINGKYRYKLIIKMKNNIKFREMLSSVYEKVMKQKEVKNVTVSIDINPINIS